MECSLLEKLLPSEVNDFYVRNEVRTDGRELLKHRDYHVLRNILAKGEKENFSCSVKLGQTHLLSSLAIKKEQ